jgi:hypothetical protein
VIVPCLDGAELTLTVIGLAGLDLWPDPRPKTKSPVAHATGLFLGLLLRTAYSPSGLAPSCDGFTLILALALVFSAST